MATAGISLTIEQTELQELQKALGKVFTDSEKSRILKEALTKAVAPVLARLQQLAPVGPTGNLQRAASSKVVSYSRSGNAVALVGFKRAGKAKADSIEGGTVGVGPDRAFHQWWLENGTKPRQITKATPPKKYSRSGSTRNAFSRRGYQMTRNGKTFEVSPHSVSGHSVSGHDVQQVTASYYASSFFKRGAFKIQPSGDGSLITDQPYSFFKKSKNPITIPAMPRGGSSGQPPLQTAWDQTSATAAEILQRELRLSLEEAIGALTRSATGGVD
jgi:hypothetical protein